MTCLGSELQTPDEVVDYAPDVHMNVSEVRTMVDPFATGLRPKVDPFATDLRPKAMTSGRKVTGPLAARRKSGLEGDISFPGKCLSYFSFA